MIAETKLHIRMGNHITEMSIRIYIPEKGNEDWYCKYEIDWPDQPRSVEVHGIDAVQCLVLALYMIGADLYCSSYHKNGQIERDGATGDFGFPVSASIREKIKNYIDF